MLLSGLSESGYLSKALLTGFDASINTYIGVHGINMKCNIKCIFRFFFILIILINDLRIFSQNIMPIRNWF